MPAQHDPASLTARRPAAMARTRSTCWNAVVYRSKPRRHAGSLSEALRAVGHASPAEAEAVRAAETLARLGAVQAEARARRGAKGPTGKPSRGELTTREIEVLRLVGEGLSDKTVADRLTISEHTVHRHISNILRKLDVSSRAAATAQAVKLGVI